jgi:hypothetical protein
VERHLEVAAGLIVFTAFEFRTGSDIEGDGGFSRIAARFHFRQDGAIHLAVVNHLAEQLLFSRRIRFGCNRGKLWDRRQAGGGLGSGVDACDWGLRNAVAVVADLIFHAVADGSGLIGVDYFSIFQVDNFRPRAKPCQSCHDEEARDDKPAHSGAF